MTRVFIYGTLKRGGINHFYMHGQRFVSEASTVAGFRLFDLGGYPGMVRDDAGISIEGELWDVDDKALEKLDELEDVEGGEYALEPVDLLPPHEGESVRSYLYKRSTAGRPLAGKSWRVSRAE